MTLPFETSLKIHPVWWSRVSLTIRTTQEALWRTPCKIFHHRRPAHWQPSSSWDQRWQWWWWWWWQWQWWWLWCSFDDLLRILVEERLPVQVDIAACQAVPPCSHLVWSPDVIQDESWSVWNVWGYWPQRLYHGWHHRAPCKDQFFFILSFCFTGEIESILLQLQHHMSGKAHKKFKKV